MKRLPIFWKIYLAVLGILFLPALLAYFLDWRAAEKSRIQMEELEAQRVELEQTASQMVEEVEYLTDLSLSDDNRAVLDSWVRQKRLDEGQNIYVSLSEPEKQGVSERFAIAVTKSGVRMARPLAVLARSQSGRTQFYSLRYPERGQNLFHDDYGENRLLLLMVFSGAVVSYFLVRRFIRPLRELERAAGLVARGDFTAHVASTVTRRQDEIGLFARAFNQMTEQVGRWLETEKRLLGDISHELRSPIQRLNVILATIEKEKRADHDILEQGQNEIRRLDAMIGELLELTRVEAASAAKREPVALNRLLKAVIDGESLVCTEENKSIRFSCAAEATVYGDAKLLERALRNVLANALRHNPKNGEVDISLTHERDEIVIRIRDHGDGVKENELEKIFLPFYRSADALEREAGGQGLGLPMVRRILQGAGGSIVASNVSDGGLLVMIRLPGEKCNDEI